MPYIPLKYWGKGLATLPATWEEMGKYSDRLYMRGLGRVSIATGEVITGPATRIGEKGMKGIIEGDRQAVGRIWNAVEMQMKANNPNASEAEIGSLTAERVEDILWLSQPTFEQETRSMAQREKGVGIRTIMRFSSQRTTLFDMFARTIYDAKNKNASISTTLKTLAALLAAQTMYAALKTAVGAAFRRRDVDDSDEYFFRTLVSTLASFGGRGLEIIVDVVNAATRYGYTMQDPFFQALQDVGKISYDTSKGIWYITEGEEEKGKRKLKKAGEKALRTAGVLTGTGIHNLAEPGVAAVEWIASNDPDKKESTRKAVPVPRSPEQARRQQTALQRQRQRAPLQRQRQQAALQRQRQRAAIPPARSQKTAKVDGRQN